MLYGPDNKPILREKDVVRSADFIRHFDQIAAEMLEAQRRIYTKILAPNGNYARYEVEQEDIRELERML